MRYVGAIVDWNDDRGYGFVTPNGGGDRTFLHVKAFERTTRRPVAGALISYEIQKDQQGRLNATAVRYVNSPATPGRVATRSSPRIAIALSFFGVLLIGWLLQMVPPLVALAYGAPSLIAFVMYARDKSAAKQGDWRTPESSLHLVAVLGGWPGAMLAQEILRHKSTKAEFQLVFWMTVAINCIVTVWLIVNGQARILSQAVLGA